MLDSKNCHKYKAGDKYWQLGMEEKVAIPSYNNSNELVDQKSEILNVWKYKRSLWLGR